ncbi:MAG: rRNA maturation RNase YbeY [Candidatus Korobacteraceae bacterium]|jgi:probable rRNA maturation factor
MLLLVHELPDVRERALALFAGKAQRAVGLRGDVVIFVTCSEEMQKLNREYRGKDEPTDVLTFPSLSPRVLGDIAISVEIAAANAAELGHSTEAEVKVLILHGLLHLAGYDHETDDGEMQTRETTLRRQLGLPVGLIERTHASLTRHAAGRTASGKAAGSSRRGGARR